MKLDVYITLNWQGRVDNGEVAIAVVVHRPDNSKQWIKIYGYKNLTYRKACVLSARDALELVGGTGSSEPIELKVYTEDQYTAFMMQKSDFKGYKHEPVWEQFKSYRDKMSVFSVKREKNHRFRNPSIIRTQKGGYHMEEIT